MAADVVTQDSRILVVDDELGIRELLTLELSSFGYTVETAADGVQALEAINLQNFQLVLCDIKMPHVGGLEVLASIRAKHPELEVILMTGYGTVETAVEAMKSGAYDFIQKPFDLKELTVLVEKCLEKSRLRATAALYEASRSVFRSIKINELLPLIAELALKIFVVDDVSIMLVDDAGRLVTAFAVGVGYEPPQDVRLAIAEKVWDAQKLSNVPVLLREPMPGSDVKSILVCPFSVDDEPLGVLSFSRTRRAEPFLSLDLHNAALFTSQIAQAVFNAKLYRRLNANIQELQDANREIEETKMQLIQSEKLAGIGQMAAGVAHELNNPLSAVIGFTQLVIGSEGLSEQQKKDLDTVYTQSKRCQVIIQNLLQFCRHTNIEKQPVQIVPILNAALELVRHKLYLSGVAVSLKAPPAVAPVSGNAGQLQQVFLNLLTNAHHAVESRKERRIAIDVVSTMEKVSILFSDSGCGIPREIQNKIFEPFFTTKPVGQGTGLGLSICYGIINQHEGTLRVKSEIGRGTTFTVELPVCGPAVEPANPPKE